jgi:hypothetical protein
VHISQPAMTENLSSTACAHTNPTKVTQVRYHRAVSRVDRTVTKAYKGKLYPGAVQIAWAGRR